MGIVLDPTKCFPAHPPEEILEEYIFHRLPEVFAAQIEEHLLLCPRCQDTVAETDRLISALKVAARHPVPDVAPARSSWRLPTPNARVVAVFAAVAIVAILAVLPVWKHPVAPPAQAEVSLSSLRGLEPLSQAPAGKPLELRLDAPDLASDPAARSQYRVEVVDASGGLVWKGPVTETGGKLVAHVPKPLGTGVYWVRLYGAGSELLREFGISVK
jgi:hypothetical protein